MLKRQNKRNLKKCYFFLEIAQLSRASTALSQLNQLLKQYFRNTFRVSDYLDLHQDRHLVSPDLGPNCLQRLSADKSCR